MARAAVPAQRSFEDLGTPLIDTTFVVVDLETTGGSPASSAITEIGAVKVRAGEVLGEFQTLVNPRCAIPHSIQMLTGITDEMVAAAEPIERVLPAFLEFAGPSVLVAHNASFDTRFLGEACARLAYPRPPNPVVCTVRLARRLVRDEVPNLRLETLARALRARTMPSHRALDDARATTDVLHALLELAARWGVTHLDDLLWFQSTRGHPSYRKVSLSDGLPRARGVYLFRGENDRLLYVGKATDLRARVRSYFSDDRRRIGDLLRALERVDHILCSTDLEASVVEARLIRAHRPPFNRAQRGRAAAWYLKLTRDRFPRLSASRTPGGLGPLPAAAMAALREALEESSMVRTCTQRVGGAPRSMCVRGQIGRCPAPCARAVAGEEYAVAVEPVVRALGGDPGPVLQSLSDRIEHLAAAARFEEAAATRDRLEAVVAASRTARAVASLVAAADLGLHVGEHVIRVRSGEVLSVDGRPLALPPDGHPDEPRLVAAWIGRNARRTTVAWCEEGWSLPLAAGRALAQWDERLRRARRMEPASQPRGGREETAQRRRSERP